jgi:hypothetical protein
MRLPTSYLAGHSIFLKSYIRRLPDCFEHLNIRISHLFRICGLRLENSTDFVVSARLRLDGLKRGTSCRISDLSGSGKLYEH